MVNLLLLLCVFIMVWLDDGFSKKLKPVAKFYKQRNLFINEVASAEWKSSFDSDLVTLAFGARVAYFLRFF
jgi:hypothetical protein